LPSIATAERKMKQKQNRNLLLIRNRKTAFKPVKNCRQSMTGLHRADNWKMRSKVEGPIFGGGVWDVQESAYKSYIIALNGKDAGLNKN
jgi:hypothetical protein